MSKKVWQVTEPFGTITGNLHRFTEIRDFNQQVAYAMRQRLDQQGIEELLTDISPLALSLLLAGMKLNKASAAMAIFGAIAWGGLKGELLYQTRAIEYGTNVTLNAVIDWLKKNPQYLQAEIEFSFLRFYFTDGSSARFIQGGYTIKRIQTSAGCNNMLIFNK